MGRVAGVVFGFVLAALGAAGPAFAVGCIDLNSALVTSPVPVSQMTDVLDRHPFGGTGLANNVRDSIAADPSQLARAEAVFIAASRVQQESLARGFGLAAAQCAPFKPKVAVELRRIVAATGTVELAQLFNSGAASGGVPLAGQQVNARCYSGAPPLSEAALAAFRAAPEDLLNRNPHGSSGLSSEVRNIAISDPALLQILSTLLAKANPQQSAAIGAGLGQAANACEIIAPAVTESIQRFVATANESTLTLTFRAVSGDRSVGAIGGPGGIGPAAAPAVGGVSGGTAVTTGAQVTGGPATRNTNRASRAPGTFAPTFASTSSSTSLFSSVSP